MTPHEKSELATSMRKMAEKIQDLAEDVRPLDYYEEPPRPTTQRFPLEKLSHISFSVTTALGDDGLSTTMLVEKIYGTWEGGGDAMSGEVPAAGDTMTLKEVTVGEVAQTTWSPSGSSPPHVIVDVGRGWILKPIQDFDHIPIAPRPENFHLKYTSKTLGEYCGIGEGK